jgi:hypothetical protein
MPPSRCYVCKNGIEIKLIPDAIHKESHTVIGIKTTESTRCRLAGNVVVLNVPLF